MSAVTPANIFLGTGRRTTSTARVRLTEGTGTLPVSGRPFDRSFPHAKSPGQQRLPGHAFLQIMNDGTAATKKPTKRCCDIERRVSVLALGGDGVCDGTEDRRVKTGGRDALSADPASAAGAATLETSEGDPGLRHARRAVSEGRIVEVSRTCYRHDRFTVYQQLNDR